MCEAVVDCPENSLWVRNAKDEQDCLCNAGFFPQSELRNSPCTPCYVVCACLFCIFPFVLATDLTHLTRVA